MRQSVGVRVMMVVCLGLLAACGVRAADTADQKAVRASVESLLKAKSSRNVRQITSLLDRKFVYKPFRGKSQNRQEFLAELKRKYGLGRKYDEKLPEMTIAVKGATATVTIEQFLEYVTTGDQINWCTAGPRQQTWKKSGGKWCLVEDKETGGTYSPEAG